jgi:hypothetical protein
MSELVHHDATCRAITEAKPKIDEAKDIRDKLQRQRLRARFGFVVETATLVASLCWGVAR